MIASRGVLGARWLDGGIKGANGESKRRTWHTDRPAFLLPTEPVHIGTNLVRSSSPSPSSCLITSFCTSVHARPPSSLRCHRSQLGALLFTAGCGTELRTAPQWNGVSKRWDVAFGETSHSTASTPWPIAAAAGAPASATSPGSSTSSSTFRQPDSQLTQVSTSLAPSLSHQSPSLCPQPSMLCYKRPQPR